jgi:hypothetical protein
MLERPLVVKKETKGTILDRRPDQPSQNQLASELDASVMRRESERLVE